MEKQAKNCPYYKEDFIPKRKDQKYCTTRHKENAKNDRKRRPYKKFKGLICEFCGFKPIHACQLDVDHIDGNHKNNNPSNLQTLCSNCHRLKSFLNKDGCFGQ